MFEDFAASLTLQMSAAFTPGRVVFDGECIYIEAPGNFVHVVVDFTSHDDDDIGTVAVYAGPDHVFDPHWVDGENGQVVLSGAEGTLSREDFEDGSTQWMFEHPRDEARIAALANALVRICAEYFAY
jgi:hypothetical protein